MVRRIWWCSGSTPLPCSLLEGERNRGDVARHILSGEVSALQAQESGERAGIRRTQYVQSPGSKQRYSLRAIVRALPPWRSGARARAAGKQRAQRRLKEARGPQGEGTNYRNDITLRGLTPIHGAVAQVAVAAGPGVQPLP